MRGRVPRAAAGPAILIVTATVGCVFFMYLTPPTLDAGRIGGLPVIRSMPGDVGVYVFRFAASAVLLGAIPLTVAAILGYRPGSLGLCRQADPLPGRHYWPILGLLVCSSVIAGFLPSTAAYYPYSKTLQAAVLEGEVWWLAPHCAAYLLFFYVPWELLFRGILILPLVRLVAPPPVRLARVPANQVGVIVALALLQTVPSTLLHVGHPISETLSAVVGGVILAYVVVRTGSILPCIALHALAGFALDITLILRSAVGAAPAA